MATIKTEPCVVCGKGDSVKRKIVHDITDLCESTKTHICFESNLCNDADECIHEIMKQIKSGQQSPFGIQFWKVTKREKQLVCHYCGSSEDVTIFPEAPIYNNQYNTFCRDSSCFVNCLDYMERLKGAPKAPYYFRKSIFKTFLEEGEPCQSVHESFTGTGEL